MAKTYTNRSNAGRAGKKALGAGNFTVVGSGKEFTFQAKAGGSDDAKPAKAAPAKVAKAAAPAKKARKSKAKIQEQPQMKKLLKLMQREKGVSVKEAAAALGDVEEHTVRGSVSRLRKVVKSITVGREFRVVRYSLPKDVEL